MDSEEIKLLEEELTKAVSYKERSAIRTKLRVLKKGQGTIINVSTSQQKKIETETTMRPKSAVITNGFGNNSSVDNRRSLEESSMPNQIRGSKPSQFSTNSTDNLSNDRFNGNSFTPKRHSYQPTTLANRGNISTSKTPPARRKETTDSIEETRGRSRTIDSVLSSDTGPEAITIRTLSKQQIQFCLTQYLNRELKPKRKIVPTGESLYLVCADPRILCRLVNVSKKNTIDMRCLTEISDTASDVQIKIAVEENMTLAVESARAIGCHITDEDVLKIIHHDTDTIHKILLKFLQARVIDLGGMEEMPSSYFTQPSFLFEQLQIDIPTDAPVASSLSDAPLAASGKVTANNNERKIDSKRSVDVPTQRNTPSQESTVRSNSSGLKVRRVSSDLPPDVRDKTEIKPVFRGKQSSDVKGLAASFEKNKGDPVTRQMSTGVPTRLESVPNGSSPSSVRLHREVVFTKSTDFKLSKSDTLTEENCNRDTSSRNRAPYTSPKKYSTQQPTSDATQKPDSKENILEPVVTPDKIVETRTESDKSAVTESPQKPLDTNDTVTSDPVSKLKLKPKLEPEPVSKPEQEPVSKPEPEPKQKLGIDLSLALSDSPIVSPLNSNDTITPVSTKTDDSPNLDSDEYLLTLQETDPTLTYEQRKRIRKLKRMRKQNQQKK